MLIVQPRREQFQPINPPRLLRRSLTNSSFLVDHKDRLAETLAPKPGAALLYPGSEAQRLSMLCAAQKFHLPVVGVATWQAQGEAEEVESSARWYLPIQQQPLLAHIFLSSVML